MRFLTIKRLQRNLVRLFRFVGRTLRAVIKAKTLIPTTPLNPVTLLTPVIILAKTRRVF